MTTGFMVVLRSEDLIPLIASFSNGVTEDVRALRQACRGCSVLVGRPPYDTFDAVFKPWFARRGTSELRQLCQVHLFVYALDVEEMEVLRWLAAEHTITAGQYHQGWRLVFPTTSTYRCPDVIAPFFRTGPPTSYMHPHVVLEAATRNHVEILRMSLGLNCGMRYVWKQACRHGCLNVVEFAEREKIFGWSSRYVNVAALNGHLDLIAFFHAHDYNGFNKATIQAAVQSGNLALVRFLLENRLEVTLEDAMCQAAASNQLEILRWLVTQPNAPYYMHKVLETACTNLRDDVLAYLQREQGLQPTLAQMTRVSRRRKRDDDL
ncbi:hypothetical protein SPRG_14936 [Saprolegnia parasitica CBS 223.65]|uniref:Uncharacterized protein n=1 Tax=Saprolegnia parasitica (strain CBS 223.65) TaxID=695850 RepID=A0A067BZV4_SAPPC|nr:hypothetical protein SPRG_14936 [Saprolegnia parasitica CBS 223.65]KDO19836.1 hypothetical protein SPRG_14936 [Saprolegnia parasitica CBS 223.65]|eukprot:XP_012209448.1 hypothetical protein SPRG_14936 [Saprolegnia parasitica CBS 223.65]